MRLLLTGASGFLGRHLLQLLQCQRIPVWTLGRSLPAGQSGESHIFCDLLADGDLTPTLRRLAPSHLLHLAWVTDPAIYQVSPLNTEWQLATQRLARAFGDAGGRHLVAVGSCAEYDWSTGWCEEDAAIVAPATPYGVAKDATRQWLQAHCTEREMRLAWARVFFPFGAGQSQDRLIPSLVSALRGQRPAFKTHTRQRRDFVAASDVALALVTLLRSPVQGCYNVSSADPVAIGDLVRLLARLLEADPGPLLALAAPALAPAELVAGDNRKLQALGWRVASSLSDGLSHYVMEAGSHHIGRTTPGPAPDGRTQSLNTGKLRCN